MKTITYDENLWRLVPVEPTDEMICALAGVVGEMFGMDDTSEGFAAAYRDALAVAPKAPKTEAQHASLRLPERKRTDHLPPNSQTMTPVRASLESYNRALDDVAALNATAPSPAPSEQMEFLCDDGELQNLLNVAVDISAGRGNMDDGLLFLDLLSGVQARLAPASDVVPVPRELLEEAVRGDKPWPRLNSSWACVGCGNWMPKNHPEAHEHEEGCEEEILASQRHWRSKLRALLNGGRS